jgi:1-acyl-sn-glycerol-3-phosphate acyltransferase
VPVTIAGTTHLLPKASLNLKSGTVTVTFHPPLHPADFSSKEALMDAVRGAIQSGLPMPTSG